MEKLNEKKVNKKLVKNLKLCGGASFTYWWNCCWYSFN